MLGNFSIRAPIPTANTPIASIKPVNAAIAPTPITANGAINAILNKTSAMVVMRPINRLALVVAF